MKNGLPHSLKAKQSFVPGKEYNSFVKEKREMEPLSLLDSEQQFVEYGARSGGLVSS